MEHDDLVSALRGAAPYVHAHTGRTVVVAFEGEVCERPGFEALVADLALVAGLGVRLVLVHGARPQIDRQLRERGVASRFVGDLRVTDADALGCVKEAVGRLRLEIEAALSRGLRDTPMGGARLKVAGGNWVTARPVGVREGVDHQFTGEVRRVDLEAVREEIDRDRIALLSPVGTSPTGEVFNLRNADVARAVATGLHADKLVFVMESDPGTWPLAQRTGDVGQLTVHRAAELLQESDLVATLTDEDRNCVRAALAACQAGVPRVHLVGARVDGALLRELYTRDGCGLMVSSGEDYDELRQATVEDVGGLLALIRPLEAAGVLVPRSRDQLELGIDQFTVMVRDGTVIACNALVEFPEERCAEIACLVVHPDYRRGERAAVLLEHAEARARSRGISRLFSLTTHTPHWFVEHGFRPGSTDDLPGRKQQLYNLQRNSLVMLRDLPGA